MYTTTNIAPTLVTNSGSVSITASHQMTPNDVAKYLEGMDFQRTYSSGTELWYRPNISGYFTWEQAVAYCLVKPWLV